MRDNSNVAIVVATYDGRSELWEPFFKFLKKNFPEAFAAPFKLYLTTNEREFAEPFVNILKSPYIRGWPGNMLDALNSIPEENVLYLQDDFFVNTRVNITGVYEALSMLGDNIKEVVLKEDPIILRFPPPSAGVTFSPIPQGYPYWCMLQAAVWRKDHFKDKIMEVFPSEPYPLSSAPQNFELCKNKDGEHHFCHPKKCPIEYPYSLVSAGKGRCEYLMSLITNNQNIFDHDDYINTGLFSHCYEGLA